MCKERNKPEPENHDLENYRTKLEEVNHDSIGVVVSGGHPACKMASHTIYVSKVRRKIKIHK